MPSWVRGLIVVGWFVATWWLMGWSGVISLALAFVVIFGAIWLIRRFV